MNDTRRSFLKNSSAAAVGSSIVFPTILTGAPANSTLKIGLIGAGGRGSGAVQQAMKADKDVKLWAIGEAFQDKADSAAARFKKSHGEQVDVPPDRTFSGLDAFQKVIDSGVDVVILATPPGFRPQHLRAAVEAKKHIFCEKPMATDAAGVRSVLESSRIAKANNTAITAGFCWRYSWSRREAFKRIHEGHIGDIKAYYATYYTGVVKPMPSTPKPDGMGDIEWQVRNWYNFVWLGGGSLLEQAVHSGDKIAWAMNDEVPVKCIANGGRAVPALHGGNIFDHYSCVFEYANGSKAFLASRQINNCANENTDYIMGTKGDCFVGKGPKPYMTGENRWRYEGEDPNMYQVEHNELFASIRDGKVINDGERMAKSTMLAIMGRMACHTGKEITWDQAINSQEVRVPEVIDFNAAHEVPPLAVPGFTKFI